MPYRTNGKHHLPEIKGQARIPGLNSEGDWTDQIESTLTQTHEMLMEKSTSFIRNRPGTSILVAAVLGGVIGWLVKRRG